MFNLCCSFLSFVCMCMCKNGLSVDSGLFNSKIFGWVIRVWVSVVCCCWLFDNCVGKCFVRFDILISFSILLVCVCCFVLLMFCIFRLKFMLFSMLRCGNKV